MYAIIETGGTQHLVREGQVIKVNDPNLPVGQEITFDRVKAFSDGSEVSIGKPDLPDVTVTGFVKKVLKAKKIRILKYRRRKHSATRRGHRQRYSVVLIKRILKGQSPLAAAPAADEVPGVATATAASAAEAAPPAPSAPVSPAADAASPAPPANAAPDQPASSN